MKHKDAMPTRLLSAFVYRVPGYADEHLSKLLDNLHSAASLCIAH